MGGVIIHKEQNWPCWRDTRQKQLDEPEVKQLLVNLPLFRGAVQSAWELTVHPLMIKSLSYESHHEGNRVTRSTGACSNGNMGLVTRCTLMDLLCSLLSYSLELLCIEWHSCLIDIVDERRLIQLDVLLQRLLEKVKYDCMPTSVRASALACESSTQQQCWMSLHEAMPPPFTSKLFYTLAFLRNCISYYGQNHSLGLAISYA